MEGLITIVFILVLYVLPGLVASKREHRNAAAIWAVNIFFGWTIAGWAVALVWSLTYQGDR